MTLTVKLLLVAALVLGIIIPFGYFLKGERSKKRYKRALGANVVFYFGALVISQPHCQPVFPVSVAVLP